MSTLFTAVSVEQQEIVAGGAFGLSATAFQKVFRLQATTSESNQTGSKTSGVNLLETTNTGGATFISTGNVLPTISGLTPISVV